jgi:hypothetical protein
MPMMQLRDMSVMAVIIFALGACGEGDADEVDVAALGPATAAMPANVRAVHRSFAPSTGEHFYTNSASEAALPYFNVEAYDYFYLAAGAATNRLPLYRCLKPLGDHFYTTSASCEGSGSALEGSLGYMSTVALGSTTPLRRLYNVSKGKHFYTVRRSERDQALQQGFVEEGIIGHVWVPTMYVTPIYEGVDPAVLRDMKASLAPNGGGDNVALGWAKSAWYMGPDNADASGDFVYVGAQLQMAMSAAAAESLPLVVNMNGGRWATHGALGDRLSASVPFWRLSDDLQQLMTSSADERRGFEAAGGRYDVLLGGIFLRKLPGTVPLYRLFRAYDRFYTRSAVERDAAVAAGYSYEGIAGFVLKDGVDFLGMPVKPLHRLSRPGQHIYTSAGSEKNTLASQGWTYEGIAAYLPDPWVTMDQEDYSTFSYDFGKQFICLSRLNAVHYSYKKRNLQAATDLVAAFRAAHPELYVGVSLDSETLLTDDHRLVDYNPLTIAEWRDWLRGTGIYNPTTGAYAGEGRSPPFSSLAELNSAMGTSFSSWNAVVPPRATIRNLDDLLQLINGGIAIWREWTNFGVALVDHHNQDMADWIAERGLPTATIYAHQTPAIFGSDDLVTAELFGGVTSGITTYGRAARDPAVLGAARGMARHFGIFEWNPYGGPNADNSSTAYFDALTQAYINTARVVAPYYFPYDANFPELSLKGSGGEVAIRNFISALRTQD